MKLPFFLKKNALLRQRLFGRKSEQTADLATPQLALFNEAESIVEPVGEDSDEEVVAPARRRGKRKPLLNLVRDSLLASGVIQFDGTRVQVLKELGREPSSQPWMWVQTGGPPDQPFLFDYPASRAQDVPTRLLEGYRGYVMPITSPITTRRARSPELRT